MTASLVALSFNEYWAIALGIASAAAVIGAAIFMLAWPARAHG